MQIGNSVFSPHLRGYFAHSLCERRNWIEPAVSTRLCARETVPSKQRFVMFSLGRHARFRGLQPSPIRSAHLAHPWPSWLICFLIYPFEAPRRRQRQRETPDARKNKMRLIMFPPFYP